MGATMDLFPTSTRWKLFDGLIALGKRAREEREPEVQSPAPVFVPTQLSLLAASQALNLTVIEMKPENLFPSKLYEKALKEAREKMRQVFPTVARC